MKIAGIIIGSSVLCSAACAQIAPIPQGWILMGQNIAATNENISAYRIAPILLPSDTIVEVIMVNSKKESEIKVGNAISKLGKPLILGYQRGGWSRSFYAAGAFEEGERRLLYTASSFEAFVRFLPDVSRLVDSWVIAPASKTDSSSKHWGSQEGSNWLSGGTNAISGGATTSGSSGARPNPGAPSMSMSTSGASSYSGSIGDSTPTASQVMNPSVGAVAAAREPYKEENLVYDPITRKFQVVNKTLAFDEAKLDGQYAYNSDRFGGAMQAHVGTLDVIVSLKGDSFRIRQSGSNFVMAEGKFSLGENRIVFEVTPEQKGEYGFLILSQYEGKVEKISIGGTVLTRLR